MVKRLLLVSFVVVSLCGVTSAFAGGPAAPAAPAPSFMPPPPGLPPLCGPAATQYQQVKEEICPVPAQLRRVRVVAPYLGGVAWPRKPLAFFGNPQTYPNPIALGRYEWLVPAVEIKPENEKYWTFTDPCCKEHKVPRCVYVKANYVKTKCAPPMCGPGPVPMAPPPPMPMKVSK